MNLSKTQVKSKSKSELNTAKSELARLKQVTISSNLSRSSDEFE